MKRILTIFLIGVLCCSTLFGCSDTQDEDTSLPGNDVRSSQPENNISTGANPDGTSPSKAVDENGDVDLTQLSSTMVYGEVNNMMMNPDKYVGKTIKAQGIYSVSENPKTGDRYHFIIIEDATACCAQGLEFIINDKSNYPDSSLQEITAEVTGKWATGEEDGQTFYYIAADTLNIK